MILNVCIYSHSERDYLKNKIHKIDKSENIEIFCGNSKSESRLQQVKKKTGRWILFLDSDCEIETSDLDKMVRFIQSSEACESTIYAGVYHNPVNSRYLQRAHNFVANLWLNRSHQQNRKFFLGGAFLIYSDQTKVDQLEDVGLFWGAEDKHLSQQLRSVGYEIELKSDLRVIHHTSSSLNHFIRRAWLQGFYDKNFVENKISMTSTERIHSMRYLFSKLDRTDFVLVPAVALHFLFLWLGKLFQKIHLKNS